MKITFDQLDYQMDAINAITSIFQGQQIRKQEFTISSDDGQGKLFNNIGIGNKIDISSTTLLQNVQQIQIEQGIPIAKAVSSTVPQFNIEMETGTGKTYVYLKSILELNEKYGFTKFIIVVPSIAIKEGVMKTLQITKDHFKSIMKGIVYRPFMYSSKNLNDIEAFATSSDIEIMVINIQSFNSTDNIFNRTDIEGLGDVSPKQIIAETNPIVIIDEPQSVDNTENAQAAIQSLNPCAVFRFSATHKNKDYPLIYKLGPVEAYKQKLVKQIEVAGIKRSIDGNAAYIKLKQIKSTKTKVTAIIEMFVKKGKEIERKPVTLEQGHVLYDKSKGIEAYNKIGFVTNISAEEGNEYIEFSGEPSIIRLRDMYNDDFEMKRAQIRKTIEEHLYKELKLNKQGIKVLSLFFIDNVSNYRQYDDNGHEMLGIYGQMFEEEYKKLIQLERFKELRDRHIPVEEVHNGYFSVDGKKRVKNTKGDSAADETTYNIIMKDKEDLLTMYDEEKKKTKAAHKLRFIFSHSTLKEGWDNPNVFQICTLIESKDTITKRQKIGRGLRIAVNQEGKRVEGFDVNTLTIMANESYEEFATDLQKEYEDEGMEFGVFYKDAFSSLIVEIDPLTNYKTALGHKQSEELFMYLKENNFLDTNNKGTKKLAQALLEQTFEVPDQFEPLKEKIIAIIEDKFNKDKVEIKDNDKKERLQLNKEVLAGPFIELWEKIKYKTFYSIEFDTENFVEKAAEKLNKELELRINKLEYEKRRLEIEYSSINEVHEVKTVMDTTEVTTYEKAPDILTFLQNETKLTRGTIIRILKESGTLVMFKRNPQMYMMETARIINLAKRFAMVDGVKYQKLSETEIYEQSLFSKEELEGYIDDIVPIKSNRTLYSGIKVDSKVEREFAQACEKDPNIRFYIKLPPEFKIKTPLGNYNPDWALLIEQDGKDKLYFIVETKGSIVEEHLRPIEFAKIRCGERHFDAIETGIEFKKAEELREVYS